MLLNRKVFLKLTTVAGAVFSTGLVGMNAFAKSGKQEEFYFVQLSDTHWGFINKKFNTDPEGTLPKAVELDNQLDPQPDFAIFTGDLTHTTDDANTRRKRLARFQKIVNKLNTKKVRFMPGEHDASLGGGEAYRSFLVTRISHFSIKASTLSCWITYPILALVWVRVSLRGWRKTCVKEIKMHLSSCLLTGRCLTWRHSGAGQHKMVQRRWNC